MDNIVFEKSSYKDIDAVVFYKNSKVFRKINRCYIDTYEKFMSSGLYDTLLKRNMIVNHTEIEKNDDYIIIELKKVFISYPWEWCFSQIKSAALLTLEIELLALEYNFSLKDANCFNIQFEKNAPVLIDTSSFEIYKENKPWIAYGQFCKNFLFPLLLMSKCDVSLNSLFLSDLDGISAQLTAKLLPYSSRFNFNLFLNVYAQAYLEKKYSKNKKTLNNLKVTKSQIINIIKNLIRLINNIKPPKTKTIWSDYYSITNYSEDAFLDKKNILLKYKNTINPKKIIDFGANTGIFSRVFSPAFIYSLDNDKNAVEKNYLTAREKNEENIFPLVFDILNPPPALGFNNEERKTFLNRIENVDLSLALALIHHLTIANNVPFKNCAEFFKNYSKYLIIEFVLKSDSKVQSMLLGRENLFFDYNIENFENEFSAFYKIIQKDKIKNSDRFLYLMEQK